MRITESQLRRLVRRALREGNPPPDEPGITADDAMGQYLMPTFNRYGGEYELVDERDTDLEELFQSALKQHYEGNADVMHNSVPLSQIWHALIDVKQRGLYTNILVPPAKTVFRIMSVPADKATKVLGIPREEITTSRNKAQVVPNPPSFRGRDLISSWTLNPTAPSITRFIFVAPNQVSILMVADVDPSGDNFLMNPMEFTKHYDLGRAFSDETEVIGGGSIPLKAMSWMWHGKGDEPRTIKDALTPAVDILSQELENIEQEGLDFYDMSALEYAAWSVFIESIRDFSREQGIPSRILDTHPDAKMSESEYESERSRVVDAGLRVNKWLINQAKDFVNTYALQAVSATSATERSTVLALMKAVGYES